VLQRRQGVNFRVNLKERGDVFGELALMYNCPRSATVAATTEAVVWVLERDVFRCAAWAVWALCDIERAAGC
jgi:cGMP-dependent protein kinase 2